jgi:hypothetical protein
LASGSSLTNEQIKIWDINGYDIPIRNLNANGNVRALALI